MRNDILTNLENPNQLERLYRSDRVAFRKAFAALDTSIASQNAYSFWNARLNFTKDEISWGNRSHLFFVILLCICAGIIIKLPAIFNLNEDFFYPRNAGFVLFPALSAYFAWKNKLSPLKIVMVAGSMLAGLIFINSLPDNNRSDTLILSCIHLMLFLWSLLGVVFVGNVSNDVEKRIGYLSYMGDLIVMTTLIVIAGLILSAITVGLFRLLGFYIEEFYFQNIAAFALPSAPILGTYLTRSNPQLVGKVSPVIARIFSPLVLVMLVIYLAAIVYSGKDPYNDREFLMVFNALLIGVMAIIFFSVAESSKSPKNSIETWVVFLLSILTIIVNGIAISAIIFRIAEWGITPNRAAVLGSNLLILVHLLLVTVKLERVLSKKAGVEVVSKTISGYLPVYFIWTIIVTFLFPFLFGFR